MALRSTVKAFGVASMAKRAIQRQTARKTAKAPAKTNFSGSHTFARTFASGASNTMPAKHVEALKDLERQVKAGEIETVIVAFTDHIGRYMGKRYDAGAYRCSKSSSLIVLCSNFLKSPQNYACFPRPPKLRSYIYDVFRAYL